MIIDTKAYSGGYSPPIYYHADKIHTGQQTRSASINPARWRESFPESISAFNFAFISSVFKGNVGSARKRIALGTGVNGAAISVVALLLTAEKLKGGDMGYAQFYALLSANEEVRA